jgi:hypothetical protein
MLVMERTHPVIQLDVELPAPDEPSDAEVTETYVRLGAFGSDAVEKAFGAFLAALRQFLVFSLTLDRGFDRQAQEGLNAARADAGKHLHVAERTIRDELAAL